MDEFWDYEWVTDREFYTCAGIMLLIEIITVVIHLLLC